MLYWRIMIFQACQSVWKRNCKPWQTDHFDQQCRQLQKWDLKQPSMPNHTVSIWQYLLQFERLQKQKQNTHWHLVWTRETSGSNNFNCIVNWVLQQTRIELWQIICYDVQIALSLEFFILLGKFWVVLMVCLHTHVYTGTVKSVHTHQILFSGRFANQFKQC